MRINENQWKEAGSSENPRSRLTCHLLIETVNSGSELPPTYTYETCGLQLTAIEVHEENGLQVSLEWDHDLDWLYGVTGADGHFQELLIQGRRYVVYAVPT